MRQLLHWLAPLTLAAAAGGDALPAINWWTWDLHAPPMGWFLFDFVVFVGGLAWLLRLPLGRHMRQRRRLIADALAQARAAQAAAAAQVKAAQARLQGAPEEAEALMARASREGQVAHDRLVAEATAYAATLLQDGATLALQEAQRSRSRLQQELRQAVTARARALLASELTAADRQALFEAAVGDMDAPPRSAVGR